MNEPFDPNPAASILSEAWGSGALLSELPAAARPMTMPQGYNIQDRLIANLGERTLGWKLGLGSHAQKRQLGVGRSVAGRLLASHVHRDGDTIELPNTAAVTIEFEIAYVLGRDIPPDEAEFTVVDAVAETRVTFELVLSRFIDRRTVGWPSFAADNAGFHALVVGDPIDPARIPELIGGLVVSLDGRDTARSLSGDDATDPIAALSDLVTTAREQGWVLPKGSIISTGTLSKPFDVTGPTGEIKARFLGRELGFRTKRAE